MLSKANRFGFKNFYKELGLSQHFTLGGLARRLQRQHPVLFRTTKYILAFSLVSVGGLWLLPGTSLPLQSQFKQFVVRR